MNSTTQTHQLPNGLTIVGEPMPDKQAAAWTILLPSGAATEPEGRDGLTSVLEGLCYRGACNAAGNPRDSRALSDALDDLGIDRGGGVDTEYATFGGATLSDYLPDALSLYADIIRRPLLPEEEWQAQRELALQNLQSLEDSPASKMFVQLRRVYFPDAYGRSSMGTSEGLNALSLEDLKNDHATRFKPQGAILALAGRFDWDKTVTHIENLFGDWSGAPPRLAPPQPIASPVYQHIEQETAQHHIGVAYGGVPSTDEGFYDYRLAISVLSGGMGARLFTEVREKRGLCYSVSASASSLRDCGFTLAYAGTTPERSQETLDVLLGELRRVREGVTNEELERARIGMLSGLVMQEESSRARTGSIARDQWILGRVRPTEEIIARINAVTPASISKYFDTHPPSDFTVVTLGPKALQVPTFA